jgi:hypothetical protein
MVSILQRKKPPKGVTLPSRLLSRQNLPVTFSHVSLQKVRVLLLVDLETGLENSKQK